MVAHASSLPDVAATGPVFVGAALAVGWTVAEIVSASLGNSRIAERLVRAAPLCDAAGLPLAAARDALWKVVGVWAIALCIAGCVVAMAWPHMSAWLMRTVDDSLGGEPAAARQLFVGFAVLTVIGMIGSLRTVGR
jgi:hypothetical protein